jgi:hypothetical protein
MGKVKKEICKQNAKQCSLYHLNNNNNNMLKQIKIMIEKQEK